MTNCLNLPVNRAEHILRNRYAKTYQTATCCQKKSFGYTEAFNANPMQVKIIS
jgi:hypothetical protein